MKRKVIVIICLIIFIVLCIMTVGSVFYKDRFGICTWINNIYCTGKTISEVETALNEQIEYPDVTIVFTDQIEETIEHSERFMNITYSGILTSDKLGKSFSDITISPKVEIDKEELLSCISDLNSIKSDNKHDRNVYLEKLGTGYRLVNNKTHRLSIDKTVQLVEINLKDNNFYIDLESQNAYSDIPLDDKEKIIVQEYDKLMKFTDFEITYKIGDDNFILDQPFWCEYICKDGDGFAHNAEGDLYFDINLLEKAWETVSDVMDTYGKPHCFTTYDGKNIVLDKGTYGNKVDLNIEKEWFWDAVNNRKNAERIPVYTQEAYHKGINDIGETYIEVDITNQHMYFFVDGNAKLHTDIVTGNMLRKHDTPCGVYYIYLKQKNRILRGPGYASHVNYWMPVVKGIGIHDALWRDEFGGEIYKTSGSHGCINTPIETMKELYEYAEVGMPVIIHE